MKAAFYKGTRPMPKGLFNIAIRLWTRSPYSHVEAVFPETNKLGWNLCASSSGEDGGVRFKYINLNNGKWDVVNTPWRKSKIRGWYADNEGKGYDYFGIVGFVLRFIKHDPTKFSCGESLAAAAGLENPHKYTPAKLAKLLGL